MVVFPPNRKRSSCTLKKLRTEPDRDVVIELRRPDHRHLPVEVKKPKAPTPKRLNPFRSDVTLYPNGVRSYRIKRPAWIHQRLPSHRVDLRGLKLQRKWNNIRGVLKRQRPRHKQGPRILQVHQKKLSIFRSPLQHKRKRRIPDPSAKLIRPPPQRDSISARRLCMSVLRKTNSAEKVHQKQCHLERSEAKAERSQRTPRQSRFKNVLSTSFTTCNRPDQSRGCSRFARSVRKPGIARWCRP